MKNNLIAFLIAATFSTNGALAQTRKDGNPRNMKASGSYSAEIVRFNVDSKILKSENIQSGWLEANFDAGTARLTLVTAFHCPKGRFCAQMMPAPFIVQLPIISVTRDSCGAKTILARRTDRMIQTLRIVDNSQNGCMTLVALPETEATYETQGDARNPSARTLSSFIATRLMPEMHAL